MREIELFLPTYETVRIWKNRQRIKLTLPLFPTYLFVHINSSQREGSPIAGVLVISWATAESIVLSRMRSRFCAS